MSDLLSSKPAEAPDCPSTVRPFVLALGEHEAVDFLLEHGGQELHIPVRKGPNSALARNVGAQTVEKLRNVFGRGALTVPTSRRWLAGKLDQRGLSRRDIAKRLRVTGESVRLYLAPPKGRPRA